MREFILGIIILILLGILFTSISSIIKINKRIKKYEKAENRIFSNKNVGENNTKP